MTENHLWKIFGMWVHFPTKTQESGLPVGLTSFLLYVSNFRF